MVPLRPLLIKLHCRCAILHPSSYQQVSEFTKNNLNLECVMHRKLRTNLNSYREKKEESPLGIYTSLSFDHLVKPSKLFQTYLSRLALWKNYPNTTDLPEALLPPSTLIPLHSPVLFPPLVPSSHSRSPPRYSCC